MLTSIEEIKVKCAGLKVLMVIMKFLENESTTGMFLTPTKFLSLNPDANVRSVLFQVSIDSGCGSTKLMGRLITKEQGQFTSDIILLSEAHGIIDSFEDLNVAFVTAGTEAKALMEDVVFVNGACHQFICFL